MYEMMEKFLIQTLQISKKIDEKTNPESEEGKKYKKLLSDLVSENERLQESIKMKD